MSKPTSKPLFKLDKLKVPRYGLFPATNMSASLDMDLTVHEGGQELRRLYHQSEKLVIVKYYKKKCSMCRVLEPLMDKVIRQYEGRIHFVPLDVLLNKDVITQAGLQGVPTCHMFYRGMLVNHFSGLLPKSSMTNLIHSTLEIYEHMDDEAVARRWEEERRKEEEEALQLEELELFPSIVYPIKGIMAPGRVLVPVHWNRLFDRGGHSIGIASRLGPRDPLGAGRLLDQFLDNENCRFDATFGTAFLSSLQKSDVVSAKGLRSNAAGGVSAKPRGLVGRIADGESNLHFLPTSATASSPSSSTTWSSTSSSPTAPASADDVRSVEVCDQTGCALIYQ